MKKLLTKIALATSFLVPLGFAMPAIADTIGPITFESYTLGTVNAQDGWTSLGAAGSGCALYDHTVSGALGTTGFASQSLRISNAITSGCFGDQTFAKPLVNAVGEVDSTNGSFSAGTLQRHFEVEFDIASAVPGEEQPGLFVSVSPDRGDGSRMSYLGFSDTADGLNIIFYDVQGESPASFELTDLGNYSRAESHHIKLTMDAFDGTSNDVVKVWIDGDFKHEGTSWENYYRFDSEASAEQSPRIVKSVLFRTGGPSAPDTSGEGFLFDNISLKSGAFQPSGSIISPAANQVVFGSADFEATYSDESPSVNDDTVQWAVRQGTCSAGTGTVLGNVDGHTNSATWDGANFSFSADMSSYDPGSYCFIFNPTDDAGQNNVRETRSFYVGDLTATPLVAYNLVGTSHTVTADISAEVSGVQLVLDITSGPDSEMANVTGTTDGNGQVDLTYINNGTSGEDTINVCVDENTNAECDEGESAVSVTKYWLTKFVTGGGNLKDGKTVQWTFGGSVGLDADNNPEGAFELTNHMEGISYHFNEITHVVLSEDNKTVDFDASGWIQGGEKTPVTARFTITDNGDGGRNKVDNLVVVGDEVTLDATPISGGNFKVLVQ